MAALKLVPDLTDVNHPDVDHEPGPLFIMDGQTMKRRADCANSNRRDYISNCSTLGTLAALGVGRTLLTDRL